jgi:hypothetical protein
MNSVKIWPKALSADQSENAGNLEHRHAQGMSSMMIVLMVVGIGTLAAGLFAIAYGTWIELSFGNSLVVAGTVAACSGLIVLGLCAVMAELKKIARRLAEPRSAADARAGLLRAAVSAAPAHQVIDDDYSDSQDQLPTGQAGQVAPPPWYEETAVRSQAEVMPEPAAPPVPAAKPRRNLMFSSSLRKDRERTAPRGEPPIGPDALAAPPAPPSVAEAVETHATFDDAWPKPERASERASDRPRASEAAAQRRGARGSTYAVTNGSAAPDRRPPARAEEQAAVTVLKSGVVDGMAYSLYSDGSIEAQMPEGMMRFSSIDELRAHLDHR